MSPSNWSRCGRRAFLRVGTAGAAGVATATAGCLEGLPPLGQRVRYGRIDAPAPLDPDPTYREWIPAPAAVPDAVDDLDPEMYSVPGNLGTETLGSSFQLGNSIARSQTDYFGMAFEAYDRIIWLNGVFVAEADVDVAAAGETLRETGYESAGTYRGYDFFDRSDNPRTVAVSDGAIVFSRGDEDRLRVETVVDAGEGAIDRRHEADDQFALFIDRVGSYPFGWFGVGITDFQTEAPFASMSYTFDEAAGYFIYHQYYPSGETPTEREIRTGIEENNRALRSAGVDIDIDESFVTVQMRIDAATFSERATEARIPLVTFGVAHDRSAGTLRIRNDGGGTLQTANLRLEPETELEGRIDWPGSALAPGDSIRLDVSGLDETDIRIVYEFPGSDHDTATIFSYYLEERGGTTNETQHQQ